MRTLDLFPWLSHTSLPQQSSATVLRYLKRLQESPVAPILKFVLFWAQSQHGLCVGVELIVKIVQEGSPRPVLEEKRVGFVELALRAEMCPLPGGSRHLA